MDTFSVRMLSTLFFALPLYGEMNTQNWQREIAGNSQLAGRLHCVLPASSLRLGSRTESVALALSSRLLFGLRTTALSAFDATRTFLLSSEITAAS